jgi:glycerol uptake facilitator-like aquaporin
MVAACALGVLLEHPESSVHLAIPDLRGRRALFGLEMGLKAIALIYSRWGKTSGAHMNPSVTLAFLSLGRVKPPEAAFEVTAQFLGAVAGVLASWEYLGRGYRIRPWTSSPPAGAQYVQVEALPATIVPNSWIAVGCASTETAAELIPVSSSEPEIFAPVLIITE